MYITLYIKKKCTSQKAPKVFEVQIAFIFAFLHAFSRVFFASHFWGFMLCFCLLIYWNFEWCFRSWTFAPFLQLMCGFCTQCILSEHHPLVLPIFSKVIFLGNTVCRVFSSVQSQKHRYCWISWNLMCYPDGFQLNSGPPNEEKCPLSAWNAVLFL